jgi:hypothetical protein
MGSGDAAMIISFSDTARVEQPFTDDRRRLAAPGDEHERPARLVELFETLRLRLQLARVVLSHAMRPACAGAVGDTPT